MLGRDINKSAFSDKNYLFQSYLFGWKQDLFEFFF